MERKDYISAIDQAFAIHPVVAILGPRQCGKTTLARMYAETLKQTTTPVTHLDRDLYGPAARPWFENISKRQVKSPKLYFRDSGILHTFLGSPTYDDLSAHPKLGASWEGYCLGELIRYHRAGEDDVFFWATHGQAELDLLIVQNGEKIGYEVKYTSAPRVTKSMRIAAEDLQLDQLKVVFPGQGRFPLGEGVEAVGLASLFTDD